jgi:hypothetical protein
VGKTALGLISTDLLTPPPQGTANGTVDCGHKTAGPVELFGLWPACHTKKRVSRFGGEVQQPGKNGKAKTLCRASSVTIIIRARSL